MSEAKEKDRILAQIKAFKPHNEIEGLSKHLYDLEQDGYISVWYDTEKKPITIRLTNKGKAFLESGGYMAVKRKSKSPAAWHRTLRKELWILVWAVTAGLIIAYLSKRLGWT